MVALNKCSHLKKEKPVDSQLISLSNAALRKKRSLLATLNELKIIYFVKYSPTYLFARKIKILKCLN